MANVGVKSERFPVRAVVLVIAEATDDRRAPFRTLVENGREVAETAENVGRVIKEEEVRIRRDVHRRQGFIVSGLLLDCGQALL